MVLGGGDGAIQDMLRFLTDGRNAREILNEISPLLSLSHSTQLARIAAQVENEMRHDAFAPPSSQFRNDIEREIHTLIDQLPTEPLLEKLKKLICCDQLRMYFQEPSLSRCYPLNRFLAHLFNWATMQIFGRALLYPNHVVSEVDCSCVGDDHFNKDHEVFFKPPHDTLSVRCRVVVPRLGIDPATVPCDRTTALHHALPYWLPNWKPPQR